VTANLPEARSASTAPQFREVIIESPPQPITAKSVLIAAIVVTAAASVFFAQWHYGFNWSDEGFLWYGSQRTAQGEVPLRDFFSYDPGRYYWSALIFRVFRGNGLFEQIMANDLFGLLGLVVSYIAMSRAGLSRGWRAAILLVLAVMLGFPRHKMYDQTLSLLAAAGVTYLISRRPSFKAWFIFGVLAGLAAFIGRNSGLYFAIAAVLALVLLKLAGQEMLVARRLAAFSAGAFIGYSPMLYMMWRVSGFASALFESILGNPNPQLRLPIPFPWHMHAQGKHGIDLLQVAAVSLLCLVVPLTYGFLILTWLKSKQHFEGAYRMVCGACIAGLPYLHHAFSRADFSHIAQGVMPFGLAAGAFGQHLWNAGRRRVSLALFLAVFGLILACWLPYEPVVAFLRMKAHKPPLAEQIEVSGRRFEVAVPQALILRAVAAAFGACGRGDGRFLPASRRWTNRPSLFCACLARARQAVRFRGLWTAVDMWTSCALFAVGRSGASLPLI